MPKTVAPHLPPGALAQRPQPTLDVDGDLVLRPFVAGDVDAVVDAYNDPLIVGWHGFRVDDAGEAQQWIDRWPAEWQRETGATWAIAEGRTGEVAGRLGLRVIDLGQGCGEISYWIRPDHRRRGAAVAAVTAAAAWLFTDVGFRRLEIMHSVHNEASCRVATRAGFPLEGTCRDALLHHDGWHDMHLHARLSDDRPQDGA